jgi:hypothetical protein
MKIKVKKVQVLDFTYDVRLTPPPPTDAPAAVQILFNFSN